MGACHGPNAPGRVWMRNSSWMCPVRKAAAVVKAETVGGDGADANPVNALAATVVTRLRSVLAATVVTRLRSVPRARVNARGVDVSYALTDWVFADEVEHGVRHHLGGDCGK